MVFERRDKCHRSFMPHVEIDPSWGCARREAPFRDEIHIRPIATGPQNTSQHIGLDSRRQIPQPAARNIVLIQVESAARHRIISQTGTSGEEDPRPIAAGSLEGTPPVRAGTLRRIHLNSPRATFTQIKTGSSVTGRFWPASEDDPRTIFGNKVRGTPASHHSAAREHADKPENPTAPFIQVGDPPSRSIRRQRRILFEDDMIEISRSTLKDRW